MDDGPLFGCIHTCPQQCRHRAQCRSSALFACCSGDASPPGVPAGCLLAELVTRLPLFPGESDQDQLYLILKCFGRLSRQQMEWLRCHPV